MDNYKAVQGHGKAFENIIKAAFDASDCKRDPFAHFDIESKFDRDGKLATSIKTSKNNIICMADARRVFSIKAKFRLVVLQYEQCGGEKIPKILYEFLPTTKEWDDIKGDLPYEEVASFHKEIKKFKIGEHKEARECSKNIKKDLLKKYTSSLMLNPKIDSKDQRRLQASINLNTLLNHIKNKNTILSVNGTVMYKGISIGRIASLPRCFNKRKTGKKLSSITKKIEFANNRFSNSSQTYLLDNENQHNKQIAHVPTIHPIQKNKQMALF